MHVVLRLLLVIIVIPSIYSRSYVFKKFIHVGIKIHIALFKTNTPSVCEIHYQFITTVVEFHSHAALMKKGARLEICRVIELDHRSYDIIRGELVPKQAL